jgi:hypothetical protein
VIGRPGSEESALFAPNGRRHEMQFVTQGVSV